MKEGAGISSSAGNMGLLNNAPHPNAARVFINWALSREGQSTPPNGICQDNRRFLEFAQDGYPERYDPARIPAQGGNRLRRSRYSGTDASGPGPESRER